MIKAPCQFCEERHLGCREKCEGWKEYTEKKRAEEERKQEGWREIEADLYRKEMFRNIAKRNK